MAALPGPGCDPEEASLPDHRALEAVAGESAGPVNRFWLTVGHQLAVDPGPMAAKPKPGIKIGWFGH